MIKLSDYVFKFIAGLKVQHVFLLPGGGCMHLVDSLGKNKELEYVSCLHEQAAAFAAQAYSEYTDKPGVALVTTGPGGTNSVTGVAAAWVESSACLFISGQAKRADLILHRGVRSMGQQEIDIVSIIKPITKYAVTIMDPQSIRYHLEKAVFLTMTGRRGPVWIDIPLDVQAEKIEEECLIGFYPVTETYKQDNLQQLSADVARVIELIKQSERPVFLVGNGVRASHSIGLFKELLKKVKIPVLLTWKAIDFLQEDDPLYCGRPGGIGQRGANFTQQNADLIIIIGARLDMPSLSFDHKKFARMAKKVMVDVDPCEILKMQTRIDVPVCADAGAFLGEFMKQADDLQEYEVHTWLDKARQWHRKYPVILDEYKTDESEYVSSYYLIDVLSDELQEADLIIPGSSGACSDILMQAFRVKSGQRVLNSPGLGAMGSGIPQTIGACLAAGKRRTINVNGDGGFQLNIQELETIHRLKLPIKFFILNNQGYGSIVGMQKNHFEGRIYAANPDSGMTLPDIKKIAAAYNIKTCSITSHSHIRKTVNEVLNSEGPFICEVMVSPNEMVKPRVMSVVKPDGTIVSKPMEDMSPLLDREEFKANMLIPQVEE